MMVPRECTLKMKKAALNRMQDPDEQMYSSIWRAMIAAHEGDE